MTLAPERQMPYWQRRRLREQWHRPIRATTLANVHEVLKGVYVPGHIPIGEGPVRQADGSLLFRSIEEAKNAYAEDRICMADLEYVLGHLVEGGWIAVHVLGPDGEEL